jgi:hypothetical protein
MKPVVFLGDALDRLRAFPQGRVAKRDFSLSEYSAAAIPTTGSR